MIRNLFLESVGGPAPRKWFHVLISENDCVLFDKRVFGDDSGEAANTVLDSLAHSSEQTLTVMVTS